MLAGHMQRMRLIHYANGPDEAASGGCLSTMLMCMQERNSQLL